MAWFWQSVGRPVTWSAGLLKPMGSGREPSLLLISGPAEALLERMEHRNVPAVVVTTKRGELVGIARRGDLRRLIEESK